MTYSNYNINDTIILKFNRIDKTNSGELLEVYSDSNKFEINYKLKSFEIDDFFIPLKINSEHKFKIIQLTTDGYPIIKRLNDFDKTNYKIDETYKFKYISHFENSFVFYDKFKNILFRTIALESLQDKIINEKYIELKVVNILDDGFPVTSIEYENPNFINIDQLPISKKLSYKILENKNVGIKGDGNIFENAYNILSTKNSNWILELIKILNTEIHQNLNVLNFNGCVEYIDDFLNIEKFILKSGFLKSYSSENAKIISSKCIVNIKKNEDLRLFCIDAKKDFVSAQKKLVNQAIEYCKDYNESNLANNIDKTNENSFHLLCRLIELMGNTTQIFHTDILIFLIDQLIKNNIYSNAFRFGLGRYRKKLRKEVGMQDLSLIFHKNKNKKYLLYSKLEEYESLINKDLDKPLSNINLAIAKFSNAIYSDDFYEKIKLINESNEIIKEKIPLFKRDYKTNEKIFYNDIKTKGKYKRSINLEEDFYRTQNYHLARSYFVLAIIHSSFEKKMKYIDKSKKHFGILRNSMSYHARNFRNMISLFNFIKQMSKEEIQEKIKELKEDLNKIEYTPDRQNLFFRSKELFLILSSINSSKADDLKFLLGKIEQYKKENTNNFPLKLSSLILSSNLIGSNEDITSMIELEIKDHLKKLINDTSLLFEYDVKNYEDDEDVNRIINEYLISDDFNKYLRSEDFIETFHYNLNNNKSFAKQLKIDEFIIPEIRSGNIQLKELGFDSVLKDLINKGKINIKDLLNENEYRKIISKEISIVNDEIDENLLNDLNKEVETDLIEYKGSFILDIKKIIYSKKNIDVTNNNKSFDKIEHTFLKNVVGMLNQSGGIIYLGLLEKNKWKDYEINNIKEMFDADITKNHIIIGTNYESENLFNNDSDDMLLKIQHSIKHNINDMLIAQNNISISLIRYLKKNIIKIEIKPNNKKFEGYRLSIDGRKEFFVREGNETILYDEERAMKFQLNKYI